MTTTDTRTFDCPWCGAISPVPGDHLGEHFACPECQKATKLTQKNTSTRAATAAPPDAPHLSGDRTFDCPWCGAIASVPSSHLGEGFRCPECAKSTKLTSTNTRRALVTAPPPDAPHPEPATAGGGKGVLVVAVLAVVGGGAWYFLAGPGAGKATDDSIAVSKGPRSSPDRAGAPSDTGAAPNATKPDAAPTAPPPGMNAGSPPSAQPSPSQPTSPELEAAALARTAARTRFTLATQAFASANSALEAWSQAHPGAVEAADAARALAETTAEIERRLADKALVPDPAKATPDQIRAADAAVRAFLDASPSRKAAAASVLEAMRADHGGREVAGVTDWRELHVTGDGFRRAAASLTGGLQALSDTVPSDLLKALNDAEEGVRSAKAEVDRLGAGDPVATPVR